MLPPSDRKPRVLLVDDYAAVLVALRRLLEPSCDVIATAANGLDAVERALALRPDVLVVDLMLPDIDGLEVCRRVKQREPSIAVIVMTASDDVAVRSAAMREGVAAFVPKHEVAQTLDAAIQEVFVEESGG